MLHNLSFIRADRCSNPLIIFMTLHWTYSCMSMSLVPGTLKLDAAQPLFLTRAEQREVITSLNLLTMFCLMHPRRVLATFAIQVQGWLMDNLVSERTPKTISVKVLCKLSVPSLSWCLRPIFLRGRFLHFALLNVIRFLSSTFLQPLKNPLNDSTTIWFVTSYS